MITTSSSVKPNREEFGVQSCRTLGSTKREDLYAILWLVVLERLCFLNQLIILLLFKTAEKVFEMLGIWWRRLEKTMLCK